MEDELMEIPDELAVHNVYFQFDEDEPVQIAYTAAGEFSLRLTTVGTDNPSVEFSDGNGKIFKLFLKPNNE